MHKFVRNLITEWRKLGLPFRGEGIVVAVSGGADSMSLLLAIQDLTIRKKLELRVTVAHFNHKLRGRESNGDEKFVIETAVSMGLEVIAASSKIKAKGNLEQNARDARYKFLAEAARDSGAKFVITGHTLNDQAETFLMNLIRGSGVDGLRGMKAVRDLNAEVKLVRPLLSWARRDDTEGFCREQGTSYRSDRMNEDEGFTRVRIRKTVLPLLSELNPKVIEALARTSTLIEESANNRAVYPDSNQSGKNPTASLELRALKRLAKPDLYNHLRVWIKEMRGNLRSLELKHIEAVERLIFSRKSGKTVELPGNGVVIKQGGRLTFRHIKVDK